MMSSVLLSLGHNASAILTDTKDGNVVGYEEERLSKIKSDSSFPMQSIRELFKHMDMHEPVDDVFVTHWFDQFGLGALRRVDKYYLPNYVAEKFPMARVHTHTPELTHHDCHAWSVVDFYERNAANGEVPEGATVLVVDGFGNFSECVSVYQWSFGSLRLQRRIYGYDNSLGLMYQYATSLVGMKENQDEYKFLGHMNNHAFEDRQYLLDMGHSLALDIRRDWNNEGSRVPKFRSTRRNRIDIAALQSAKFGWYTRLRNHGYGLKDDKVDAASIGVVIQTALEDCVESLVPHDCKHLLVAGGCFMNVRLNDAISRLAPETFCVNPLAGDQGVAIGMSRAIKGRDNRNEWNGLAIGKRPVITESQRTTLEKLGVEFVKAHDYPDTLAELILDDFIVNVFRTQAMEFGARALCRTSTIARPTQTNVEKINDFNKRSTVMPMAPVMKESTYRRLFPSYAKKIVASDEYMITAMSVGDTTSAYRTVKRSMYGGAHPDPFSKKVSCRPQVAYDDLTLDVLERVNEIALINTSLNEHGSPILFDANDLERFQKFWLSRLKEVSRKHDLVQFKTIVVED